MEKIIFILYYTTIWKHGDQPSLMLYKIFFSLTTTWVWEVSVLYGHTVNNRSSWQVVNTPTSRLLHKTHKTTSVQPHPRNQSLHLPYIGTSTWPL